MNFMIEVVNVPKDRINVIKDREAKDKLERSVKAKLSFEENSVIIESEGLDMLTANNIVKAMARGFSPAKAFRLLNEEEFLDIIEIDGEDNKLKIIKSRLIGTNGKTWKMIERFSGASLSVYGKTVSIIGKFEQMSIAKEAVKMILRGAKHSNVYRFLFDAGQEPAGLSV
jgi:ribosomal RNA assembly protein